jgi:hypothetical protein
VPAAQSGFDVTFHGLLSPSSSCMTIELWPPICMMVLASGWKLRRPEVIDSELLYSDQLNSFGITVLPEPDIPALTICSRLNLSLKRLRSKLTAAFGLEVIFSVSSLMILPCVSVNASLALTEPTSRPRRH